MFPPSAPLLPIPTSAKASPRAAPQAKEISGWVRHIHSGRVRVYCANLGTSTVFQSVARLCSLNALRAHKALNTKMCEISSPKDFSGPRVVTFTGSTHPETQQMLGEHPWGPRGGQGKSQHSQNQSQARSRRGIRSLPRPRLSAKFGTAARGGRALGN